MARRLCIRHLTMLAGCLAAAFVLAGCSSTDSVTFTNVSESWLDVRFFVGKTGANSLKSRRKFQVKPGETATFKVNRSPNFRGHSPLVHLQVQSVTPSWKGPGKQYWMELLTQGPVKIVVRGKDDDLKFETGSGEVASIPKRQIKRRFDYKVAGAPSPPS